MGREVERRLECPSPGLPESQGRHQQRTITLAAARNAHRAPRASYVSPMTKGPRQRPSAPSACAAPRVVPCSLGEAYTDTSPLAPGDTSPCDSANTTVQPYSRRELRANGTAPIATATPTVPAITSRRSPNRRASFPNNTPCTNAPVNPNTVKKSPSSLSCQPNTARACSGSAAV